MMGESGHPSSRRGILAETVSPIISDEFREAMRFWASGVTIVSAEYAGARHGMTVSAFFSVSITPPIVLVSLSWGSRTRDLVQKSNAFGITILTSQQQDLSDRFAGRYSEDTDRFDGLQTFKLSTGAPLLMGGLAYFDCRVVSAVDIGEHTLYIGEVVAVCPGQAGQPLLYYDRGYKQVDS
jgi:flavin reductase (DIM6/NTAB) family NADH-FMN oxidoreductase RutF